MSIPRVWGATPDEVRASYPCDGLLANPQDEWFRALTVRADRRLVFRWLCQLKYAPYSYDLLDNLGRRSPRLLIPGSEQLRTGQRFMTIFEPVDFRPDHHLTLAMRSRWGRRLFGDFAVSYVVTDAPQDATRLIVKLVVGGSGGPADTVRRGLLAWGDLFMMHRQLRNMKSLAERHAHQPRPPEGSAPPGP